MEQWNEIGKSIEKHMRPSTFPIAVRFLKNGEDAPEKARFPVRDLGEPIAVCQGLTLVRTRGWTIAFDLESSSCPLVNYCLGWDEAARSMMTMFFKVMNYSTDEKSAEARIDALGRLEPGECEMLVISPLSRTRIQPHLIMVYGNPAQVMRAVQSVSSYTGKGVRGDFGGLGGSCNEGIIRTYIEDEPRIAMPGNGDRAFAATQNDEMIFSMPASWTEKVLEGLEATSERGVRYPIPTFLEYRLPFADLVERFQGS